MSGLNEAKGNMYPFLNDYPVKRANRGYTWNTVKGKCPHNHDDCYCYMNVFVLGDLRFDRSELRTDLGEDNFIFVGSSCDMFADAIPSKWIEGTLDYMSRFDNKYLIQTKNTPRLIEFKDMFPDKIVLGTTMETNRTYPQMCNAPHPMQRASDLLEMYELGFDTMVTCEPIMAFDLEPMVSMITKCNPRWVNFGADSKDNHLIEPRLIEGKNLILRLRKTTRVMLKDNSERILGREFNELQDRG